MTWLAIPLFFFGVIGFLVSVAMLIWAAVELHRGRIDEWEAVQQHRRQMQALRPPRVLP